MSPSEPYPRLAFADGSPERLETTLRFAAQRGDAPRAELRAIALEPAEAPSFGAPAARVTEAAQRADDADAGGREPAEDAATPGPVERVAAGEVPTAEGAVLGEISAAIAAALSRRLQPEQYTTWFRRVRLVRLDERAAVFAVPNEFAREWIATYYLEPLSAAVLASLGVKRRVELRVDPEAAVQHSASETGLAPERTEGPSERQAEERAEWPADRRGDRTIDGPIERRAARPTERPRSDQPPHLGQGSERAWRDAPGTSEQPRRPAAQPERAHPPSQPAGPERREAEGEFGPYPARPEPTHGGSNSARRDALLHANSDIVLNPRYAFEHYVVGPCNRFAHAASMGAAEHPGRAYNPLFLHGRVGVGKTHLLQAFCFMILERQPASRILYLSCETFVNHFINALENGDLMGFREKYRSVDVLVVDDIQLLANKERTQEEFFHTFNTLYNAGKQIVLSSDSPPKDIPTLQDRLVSRFKWGMVTEVSAPCFETRVAIVKRKGRERNREVPDEVAQFIAEHIEENVRELEGAVTRLLGYAGITSQTIDVTLARNALADLIDVQRGAPTMDDIIAVAVAHFSVKLSDLQSKRRTAAIAYPRQVAMFLARRITRHSLEEIGGYFGGRDHTTVLYAVDKIAKLCERDPETAKLVGSLLEKLTGRR